MNETLRRAPALIALYAVLLAYAAVTLLPFAWMLITSFKESRDVFRLPPSFVPTMLYGPDPLANYTEVLTQHDFLLYFRNSFFVSTMAALGQVATCALAGYAFARMELPGKNVIFALILATAFVPTEVTIIPEFLLMRSLGWIDSFLPLIVPSFLVGSFGTFMLREYFREPSRRIRRGRADRRGGTVAHLLAGLSAAGTARADLDLRDRLYQ